MKLERKEKTITGNSRVYLNEGGGSGAGGFIRSTPDYNFYPGGGAGVMQIARTGDSFFAEMRQFRASGWYTRAEQRQFHGYYQSKPGAVQLIFEWFCGIFFR